MRSRTLALLLMAAMVAACGATQQQRELQAAKAIQTTNESTAQALDFGIIKADEGEVVQGFTRLATQDLKRAISARRAGQPKEAWERIMDIVFDGLAEAARILEGREGKK